ncbi:hypothetical protein L204_105359 [Cryptococcus depauperatus]
MQGRRADAALQRIIARLQDVDGVVDCDEPLPRAWERQAGTTSPRRRDVTELEPAIKEERQGGTYHGMVGSAMAQVDVQVSCGT